MPLLFSNIYLESTEVVRGVGRRELHIKGSTIYLFLYVREVLMFKMVLAQVDVALWGVFVSWCTQVGVMGQLLGVKRFE